MTTSMPSDRSLRERLDPMALWRWGFSIVLIGCGLWLVVASPQIGGASGRTLGLVVIAYAVVRLGLGWFMQKRHKGF